MNDTPNIQTVNAEIKRLETELKRQKTTAATWQSKYRLLKSEFDKAQKELEPQEPHR
jgi:chromosome segregation ATPase